jgi:hypothetical protein
MELAPYPSLFAARTSIYEHLRRHIHPEVPGLLPGGETLPDEEDFWSGRKLRWVAGGLDGTARHRAKREKPELTADQARWLLNKAAEGPTEPALRELHEFLVKFSVIDYIDTLLPAVASAGSRGDSGELIRIARWLVTASPNREPVKAGIALLGVLSKDDESDLLITLGRHDEFTLYSAVALTNMFEFPDTALMELGKHVHGWGRIGVIERLQYTTNPAVKNWMLRDGFRNTVMYEYSAYICAVAADLAGQLAQVEIDDELFDAATELLDALLTGGPAKDINHYDDGVSVVQSYLRHLRVRPPALRTLRVSWLLKLRASRHSQSERSSLAEGRCWTPVFKNQIAEECREVMAWPVWPELTEKALASDDPREFWLGLSSARILNIDTCDLCFAKLVAGGDYWFQVMGTDDPERAKRVVDFALETLPLKEMATGPALEIGQGPRWATHRYLGVVLQGLEKFPGIGWPLIRAGFHSPGIRVRIMALRAFKKWSRALWPNDALTVMRLALNAEPDDELRQRLAEFLAEAQAQM